VPFSHDLIQTFRPYLPPIQTRAHQQKTMAGKRKRTSNPEDNDEDTTNTARESKRFAWLKPQVKNVSKHAIKSKWSSLPEPVQSKVRDLFRSLERPVIVRQRDERKRIEAQVALGGVVKTCVFPLYVARFQDLT
jgi:hypothetical protein